MGPRDRGCIPSPALKNVAVVTCSHSALPYIPDPTSPPRLGLMGLWGGWGAVLDFRVGPHQLSALCLRGGVWVSIVPEPVPRRPCSLPGTCGPCFLAPYLELGGSSLEAGAVREEGRRSGRGEEGRAQIYGKFITGLWE